MQVHVCMHIHTAIIDFTCTVQVKKCADNKKLHNANACIATLVTLKVHVTCLDYCNLRTHYSDDFTNALLQYSGEQECLTQISVVHHV